MARSEAGIHALKAGPALRILVVAMLAVLPLVLRGESCGHDFDFHLLSWMEAARAWHSGILYPHWVQDANYGAGEPRLVFYPPVSWMLGGLLGGAISWAAAPLLFVLFVLLGCGWSLYLLAREWLSPETASFVACLYIVNPYMLFVVYERSAYGELLSGVWLPLVMLFALRRSPSVVPLGATIAAIWLTNAPSAVLASYTLAVLALGMMLAEGRAWPIWRAVGGMALGLTLAAFYIVPAAYERRWVEVSRAILPGLRIQDSFLMKHTGNVLHDQVLRYASWILLFEMAAAGIAAWIAWRRRSGANARIALTALLPVILFLQFPVSEGIWTHAPELKFLQFPWRWTLILSVAACVLIGMSLEARNRNAQSTSLRHGGHHLTPSWARKTAWSIAIVAMVFCEAHLFFQSCDDQDAVAGQLAAFRMGPTRGGIEGTDEYTPAPADNSEVEQGLPMVRVLREADAEFPTPSQPENPDWLPEAGAEVLAAIQVKERNPEDWSILVRSQAPGYAVLRLMDYPAWRITLNDVLIHNRPSREDGLIAIPVLAGANKIGIRWVNTPDVIAGRITSAVALLLLVILIAGPLRRRMPDTVRTGGKQSQCQV